jgi:hypothetical protein
MAITSSIDVDELVKSQFFRFAVILAKPMLVPDGVQDDGPGSRSPEAIEMTEFRGLPGLRSGIPDCVATGKTMHIRLFVIPGSTRNPLFFSVLSYWMPDQVRHDRHKFNVF